MGVEHRFVDSTGPIKRAQARPLEILDPCNDIRLGVRVGQPEASIDQTAAGWAESTRFQTGHLLVLPNVAACR